MSKVIAFADPKYSFLMNSYVVDISMGGDVYPTLEHAFQASKCALLHQREMVRNAFTAKEAKQIGRRSALVPHWEQIKDGVMEGLLEQKFAISSLRSKLLMTRGSELVAGGDEYWGMVRGKGLNKLGKMVMAIRDSILQESVNTFSQSCRDFLLSLGWEREPAGDQAFNECWVPPYDKYLWFGLFEACYQESSQIKSDELEIDVDFEDEDYISAGSPNASMLDLKEVISRMGGNPYQALNKDDFKITISAENNCTDASNT